MSNLRGGVDEKSFYVYLHVRKTDGKVFYVGKGSQGRAWSTEGRSDSWWLEWRAHGFQAVMLQSNLSHSEAHRRELETIKLFISLDHQLVNVIGTKPKPAFRIHRPR